MERDDALQRVSEKERELAQTTHALRMRIRRLEVSEPLLTADTCRGCVALRDRGSILMLLDLEWPNGYLFALGNTHATELSAHKRPRHDKADLDTQQDAARRARGEAEHAGHIMKKHLSSTSAGVVSQIQQEQVPDVFSAQDSTVMCK